MIRRQRLIIHREGQQAFRLPRFRQRKSTRKSRPAQVERPISAMMPDMAGAISRLGSVQNICQAHAGEGDAPHRAKPPGNAIGGVDVQRAAIAGAFDHCGHRHDRKLLPQRGDREGHRPRHEARNGERPGLWINRAIRKMTVVPDKEPLHRRDGGSRSLSRVSAFFALCG